MSNKEMIIFLEKRRYAYFKRKNESSTDCRRATIEAIIRELSFLIVSIKADYIETCSECCGEGVLWDNREEYDDELPPLCPICRGEGTIELEVSDETLTLIEAENKGYDTFSYDNKDYVYKDEKDIYHLIRDGKELCKGTYVHSYGNKDYEYKDEKDIFHLIRDGKELCKGTSVDSYGNQDYEYEDKYGIFHLIRDGKELCKGRYVFSYDNGDYEYKDEDGIFHLIRDGKELDKEEIELEVKDV